MTYSRFMFRILSIIMLLIAAYLLMRAYDGISDAWVVGQWGTALGMMAGKIFVPLLIAVLAWRRSNWRIPGVSESRDKQ